MTDRQSRRDSSGLSEKDVKVPAPFSYSRIECSGGRFGDVAGFEFNQVLDQAWEVFVLPE
jgi:hypothetical protein